MKKINQKISLLLVAVSCAPFTSSADGFNDFQLKRLFEPTVSQKKVESNGKVYIYDGINAEQISDALDLNFDRIDSMMFTRIVNTNVRGDEVIEEDGCD